MNTLEKLDQLLLNGAITEIDYFKEKAAYADRIIAHIEAELAVAYDMHDQVKGKDAAQAFAYMVKATTIQHILDEIE